MFVLVACYIRVLGQAISFITDLPANKLGTASYGLVCVSAFTPSLWMLLALCVFTNSDLTKY